MKNKRPTTSEILKFVPFISEIQDIENIEKRNKKFNSLSKIRQRKEISYESLKLILNRQVDASCGAYWSDSLRCIKSETPADFQKDLLNALPPVEECKVCQRGLMMLSQIRLGNEISSHNNHRTEGSHETIKGFDYDDFYNMEKEFERESYSHPYQMNSNRKLANICCNILANGNFNTEDRTDYLLMYDIRKYIKNHWT